MKLAIAILILGALSYLVIRYRDKLKEWAPGIKNYFYNGLGIISTVALAVTDWLGKADLTTYMTKENALIFALGAFTIGTLLSLITKRASD